MSYIQQFTSRLQEYKIETPALPWKLNQVIAIGGLLASGYDRKADLVLIASAQGRGVFDVQSGQRLGRDLNDDLSWYDPVKLTVQGIGPLTGKEITVAGLDGGGLPLRTYDGWSMTIEAPSWPKRAVFLEPPGQSVALESTDSGCHKVFEDYELRVAGFSQTGQSFIIGTSSEVYFYSR